MLPDIVVGHDKNLRVLLFPEPPGQGFLQWRNENRVIRKLKAVLHE
jgi:hypothetical protein